MWFLVVVKVLKAGVVLNPSLAEEDLPRSDTIPPDLVAKFLWKPLEEFRRRAWVEMSASAGLLRADW
jgi:hypothetical protein